MLAQGDALGRYVLLERIASGGMGEVFLAARPGPVGFGPFVALKILRPELADDPQFIDMLVDEANISKFLNHQNVVSVLDLGEAEGTYFIAMEFVQGITAERLIESMNERGQAVDIPVALFIGTELTRALKYAHTRVDHSGQPMGIIHRDVTPANILLSVQGEVKLTDFGIARARGRIHQTQAGMLKGKFGYMAPEMVRGRPVDHRADLFCAGVCMYLLLTGHHPAAHCSVVEAIQRFEDRQVAPPSTHNPLLSDALDHLVLKALDPDPDRRWSSAAELGEAMQDCLLSRSEWRSRGGAGRLAETIADVAPDVLREPVSAQTLDALFRMGTDATRPTPAVSRADVAAASVSEPEAAADSHPTTEGSIRRMDEPELPSRDDSQESGPVEEATRAAPAGYEENLFDGPSSSDDRTVATASVSAAMLDGAQADSGSVELPPTMPSQRAERALAPELVIYGSVDLPTHDDGMEPAADKTIAGASMFDDPSSSDSEDYATVAGASLDDDPEGGESTVLDSPLSSSRMPPPSASIDRAARAAAGKGVEARSWVVGGREHSDAPSVSRGASAAAMGRASDEAPTLKPGGDELRLRPGSDTNRWLKGEIEARALQWDDDAAARRLLATRNDGGAEGSSAAVLKAADPALQPTQSRQPANPVPAPDAGSRLAPSTDRRSLWVVALLAAMALAAGGIFAFTTQALWPRLRLETDPPGATARIDGRQVGRTPLTVRVEPGVSHRIEFEKAGYEVEVRQTVGAVRRGGSYTVRVTMQPSE